MKTSSCSSRLRRLLEDIMNYKKRKRRTGGIKGCCGLCMLEKYKCIHHRIETRQEKSSRLSEKEYLSDNGNTFVS